MYSIKYYEIDARCKIVTDNLLDSETCENALDAMWEAKVWLNGDEARDVRTVLADPETLYMYASPKGDPHEDVVAVIETVHTD